METSVIAGYIATGVVALIVGMLLDRWRVQPIVVWYLAPSHKFVVDAGGQKFIPVNTETLYLQNLGRVAAMEVQAVFLFKPRNLNVQPRSFYHESQTPEGNYVMTFPSLGPHETIAIQILYYDTIPDLQQVRSQAGTAKNIPVWLVRRFPQWYYWAAVAVMLLGIAVVLVTVIRLAVMAWEKLPTGA